MKAITAISFSELQSNTALPSFTKPAVSKEQLVQYAQASGDLNPLHTDDNFAKSIGLDGVIAHGMLIMGFLGQYVQEIAGTESVVHQFNMRFGAMTKPGDVITCGGFVKQLMEIDGQPAVALELFAEKAPGERVGTGSAVLVCSNPLN
ncbi:MULTISPECIES: MaoC/PaaZ C-terminal domain-containing protein [unclassified Planococcus (in: firmicutes)]|uniref:MaoC/PaaZ C-terminal domain-containing protein n=1 Tax=unclassified Planococcus (in: firmicutes) TaxID=2662419 RepID=UPI0011EEB467|nr:MULTISPECIES: MaoC/PaaZ C-terminal domain-containing protein [unclassified Planococcus (in: firmicutes)]KAA0956929.1 dehydratase [Planococcus sp. ANT_H30]MDJ0331559.1 MaoC/PaaZ C-terminal domain-containing protein [Planococcus sp. S3-L1]